jgi:hypothetical protein
MPSSKVASWISKSAFNAALAKPNSTSERRASAPLETVVLKGDEVTEDVTEESPSAKYSVLNCTESITYTPKPLEFPFAQGTDMKTPFG